MSPYLITEPDGHFRVGGARFDDRDSAVDYLCHVLDVRPSERRVITRVACGLSLQQIAMEYGLSPHTVETHAANLRKKSGTASTIELLLWAQSVGLVEPPRAGRWARWGMNQSAGGRG